jgi:hypothetical protein
MNGMLHPQETSPFRCPMAGRHGDGGVLAAPSAVSRRAVSPFHALPSQYRSSVASGGVPEADDDHDDAAISITTLSMLTASRRMLADMDIDTERAISAMRRNSAP